MMIQKENGKQVEEIISILDDDDDDDIVVGDGDGGESSLPCSTLPPLSLTNASSSASSSATASAGIYKNAATAAVVDLTDASNTPNPNTEYTFRKRKRRLQNPAALSLSPSKTAKPSSNNSNNTQILPTLRQWTVKKSAINNNSNSNNSNNNNNNTSFQNIKGIVENHPDSMIQNGSFITIRKVKKFFLRNKNQDDNDQEILQCGDIVVSSITGLKFQLGIQNHPIIQDNQLNVEIIDDDDDCIFVGASAGATTSMAIASSTNEGIASRPVNANFYSNSQSKSKVIVKSVIKETKKYDPIEIISRYLNRTSTSIDTHSQNHNHHQMVHSQHQLQHQAEMQQQIQSQNMEIKITPIARILEVFPDMHEDHIRRQLVKHGLNNHELTLPIINSSRHVPVPLPSFDGHGGDNGSREEFAVQRTLIILASEGAYPKSKDATGLSTTNTTNDNGTSSSLASLASSKYNHDYASSSIKYQRTIQYQTQVQSYLSYIFPFLSTMGISALLSKFDNRCYLTFMFIIEKLKSGCKEAISNGTIKKDVILSSLSESASTSASSSTSTSASTKNWSQDEINEYEYVNLSNLLDGSRLLPEQRKSLEISETRNTNDTVKRGNNTNRGRVAKIKTTLTRPRTINRNIEKSSSNISPIEITDEILRNEILYTHDKYKEWKTVIENKLNRKQLRLQSELDGTAIECSCCYADCAFEEMVHCVDEGHLFCIDCVRRHAEEQIFGNGKLGNEGGNSDKDGSNSGDLSCMCVDGCNSKFARSALMKALPSKVMQKYDELQATQVLEKAGMKDLCKCPKCDFQAIVPETEIIFHCPILTCQYQSCRKCGEEAHIPLQCEEVEKKDETSARIRVEEAMTKAKVRRCPNGCKQPFYKSDGCNKMTCPTCKSFICYVCRELIPKKVGYAHFCQTPHCQHKTCNKCPLYSNAEEDDKRAIKEAGLKTLEQIRLEEGKKGDDKTKRIDIDGMIKQSRPKSNHSDRGRARVHRHHQVARRPHQLPQGMQVYRNYANIDVEEMIYLENIRNGHRRR